MKNKNDISFQFYLFSNKMSCISMSIYLKNLITIDFRVIFCTLKTYKNPAQKVTEQSGKENNLSVQKTYEYKRGYWFNDDSDMSFGLDMVKVVETKR